MRIDRDHLLGQFLVASEFSSCACHTGGYLCPDCRHHPQYAQQLHAKGTLFFKCCYCDVEKFDHPSKSTETLEYQFTKIEKQQTK